MNHLLSTRGVEKMLVKAIKISLNILFIEWDIRDDGWILTNDFKSPLLRKWRLASWQRGDKGERREVKPFLFLLGVISSNVICPVTPVSWGWYLTRVAQRETSSRTSCWDSWEWGYQEELWSSGGSVVPVSSKCLVTPPGWQSNTQNHETSHNFSLPIKARSEYCEFVFSIRVTDPHESFYWNINTASQARLLFVNIQSSPR